MVGWPYRKGFLGGDAPLEVPPDASERLALMKRIAEGWAEPFRECMMEIPVGTPVQAIKLEDFVPRPGMWDNMHGRVTMIGEAAHAMTMCMFYFSFMFSLQSPPQERFPLIRRSQRRRRKSRHNRRLRPSLQNLADL